MSRLFHLKILIVVILALLGVGLMVAQQRMLRESFIRMGDYMNRFHHLQTEALKLKDVVLKANYYLYYDNDKIIEDIKKFKRDLRHLERDHHLKEEHTQTLLALSLVSELFDKIENQIYDFLTLNASMKNSTIYLPTLTLRALKQFNMNNPEDRKIILLLSRINAEIFLTKSALDISFMEEIRHYYDQLTLESSKMTDPTKIRLLKTVLRHLSVFIDYFPRFEKDLNDIMHAPLNRMVDRTIGVYRNENAKEVETVRILGYLFVALYLLMIIAVLYFVYYLEKESRIDVLTGLGNRKDFEIQKQKVERPVLILINIDRFKHINEYYGTKVGDALLVEVAKLLRLQTPATLRAKLFRLGGDDFGILYDVRRGGRLSGMIEKVVEAFEKAQFIVDDLPPIDVSVTIGVSLEKERLLETADMALKAAKSSKRERFVIYSDRIDETQQIAANIKSSKQLKRAMAENRIIPYFQPIVDLEKDRIVKYEALARLKISDSEVLTPYHFLEAANQTKLSGELTHRMLLRTLQIAQETEAAFSVNVSASDIESKKSRQSIYQLLQQYPDIAPKITFEILESEEIEDYEEIGLFVEELKRYGCQVAIDDFGSGYSNFEKLLQLDIDLIKIDGTLIRDIDHDRHSELVVRTIVDFAQEAGLPTVAEFVHCGAVAQKVKTLGIQMGQGFYLGRPKPVEDIFVVEKGR